MISLDKVKAGMKKCPQQEILAIYYNEYIQYITLQYIQYITMSTWGEYGLSFTALSLCVNDGSKTTHQYKGEYQCGGQSNCWNYSQFKDSVKIYNWDKFSRSIRQRNN